MRIGCLLEFIDSRFERKLACWVGHADNCPIHIFRATIMVYIYVRMYGLGIYRVSNVVMALIVRSSSKCWCGVLKVKRCSSMGDRFERHLVLKWSLLSARLHLVNSRLLSWVLKN